MGVDEKIPAVTVVTFNLKPKKCWLVTECRLIACDPNNRIRGDILLAEERGGYWNEKKEIFSFFFENIKFPKAGKFEIKYEFIMHGYWGDRGDRCNGDRFPASGEWTANSDDFNKYFLDVPLEDRIMKYWWTGYRAGTTLARTYVEVGPKWKGWYAGPHKRRKSTYVPDQQPHTPSHWAS